MKKLYLRSLMLLLALTWIIPKVDAQTRSITVNTTADWTQKFSTPSKTAYSVGVGADGKLFTIDPGTEMASGVNAGYRMGSDGVGQISWGIKGGIVCSDDAGNIIGIQGLNSSVPTSFRVWSASVINTNSSKAPSAIAAGLYGKTTITNAMTYYPTDGVLDMMSATGDVISGTGYIWFTTRSSSNIYRMTVKNATATALDTYPAVDASGNSIAVGNSMWGTYVKPYDTNKLLVHMRSNGMYDCEIKNGQAVCTKFTINNRAVYNIGAEIFMFAGHKLIACASGSANYASQFTIYDMSNGNAELATIELFSAVAVTSGLVGSVIRTKQISDTELALYAYKPSIGAAKFTLTAELDPNLELAVSNLTATCVKEEDMAEPNINKPGRQNACITWEANPSWTTQPTSYKVQRQRTYTNSAGTVVNSSWSTVGTTTTIPTADAPFVHYDISYLKVSKVNYATTFKYRVIPVFGTAEGSAAESNGVNPEFIPIAPNWLALRGEEAYDGLCMTELFWEYPGYGLKPDAYEITRDGEIITGEERVAAFVKVDYNAKAGHTHSYQIQTYYNGLDNTNPAKSAVRSTTIGARDWSKPKYTITEIYNFSIEDGEYEIADGAKATNFLTRDCYPQATFKNGKWYVSQMYDGLVDRGLYDQTNSRYVEGNTWADYATAVTNAGSHGGILVFDGDAQAQSNGKMLGGYRLANINPRVYQNRGIAVDDAGNIFIRGLAKSSYATSTYQWCHDFEYMMTCGEIYKANADGTYSATKYTVDFSAVNFAEMSQDTGGPIEGRCDYFSMSGDVFSSEGAYLYVAPTQTKAVYVFNLKAGTGTTITAGLAGVYFEHGINQQSGNTYGAGIENFAFPVNCEGREKEFIHNVRSNIFRNLKIDASGTIQYSEQLWTGSASSPSYLSNKPYSLNVSGVEGYSAAQPTVNAEGRIYDFHSRVNNPGGSTFEFNGELFIVTPISQYSINTGSFYVGRAYRGLQDGSSTLRVGPDEADLCHIVPVGTVYQKDEVTAAGSNSAGVWVYGEHPTLADELADGISQAEADVDNDGVVDYAYIYVYAPAERFAKYKLTPDALFPPSPNTLSVNPVYAPTETNPDNDLVQYDAVVDWEPMEYSYNVPDENGVKTGNYSVYYYTVTLYDYSDPANPVVVGTDKVYVYDAATGTSADKVVLGEDGKVVNYTTTFPDVPVYDADGNKIPYVSEVVVTYLGEEGTVAETAGEKNSIETESEGDNSFETAAPTGTVTVGKTEEWADWNKPFGVQDENDGYWDKYRIELEPTNPQWEDGQQEEPVSYYTIDVQGPASETNDATDKQICDFYLYDPDTDAATEGVQNITGLEPDAAGYVHITDCIIPGNYVFTPDDNIPDIYWDELDYTGATTGENAPEDDGKINPNEWTFYVNAEFAAGNEKLRVTETGEMTNDGGVPTEVEVIRSETSFRVYPNPASTTINISSSTGIQQAVIYTLAGVEAKSVDANGVNHLEITVDDLAEGYYLLKVNNQQPVKILVK